jgi:hypothetical protein
MFPARWHRRVAERHGVQARPVLREADQTNEGDACVVLCLKLRQASMNLSRY